MPAMTTRVASPIVAYYSFISNPDYDKFLSSISTEPAVKIQIAFLQKNSLSFYLQFSSRTQLPCYGCFCSNGRGIYIIVTS